MKMHVTKAAKHMEQAKKFSEKASHHHAKAKEAMMKVSGEKKMVAKKKIKKSEK